MPQTNIQLIFAAHHTALSVENFEGARDFFVRVLGFYLEGEMDKCTDIGPIVGLSDASVRYRLEPFKYYSPWGKQHGRR
jgi:catechol 2,3-dioxygenase-like lactoylglutathione lyase family enzyme